MTDTIQAESLSLDMIESLLSESRIRGAYLPVIEGFFESGALALDMSAEFPGKTAANLRNVTTQNADKVKGHPQYKVVVKGKKDDAHVILINLDALATAKAAKAAQDAQ